VPLHFFVFFRKSSAIRGKLRHLVFKINDSTLELDITELPAKLNDRAYVFQRLLRQRCSTD
jgi:hypothetical protein